MKLGSNNLGSNVLASLIKRVKILLNYDDLEVSECIGSAPIDVTPEPPVVYVPLIISAVLSITTTLDAEIPCLVPVAPTLTMDVAGAFIRVQFTTTFQYEVWRRDNIDVAYIKRFEGDGLAGSYTLIDDAVILGRTYTYYLKVLYPGNCGWQAGMPASIVFVCSPQPLIDLWFDPGESGLDYEAGVTSRNLHYSSLNLIVAPTIWPDVGVIPPNVEGVVAVSPAVTTLFETAGVGACGTVGASALLTVNCPTPDPPTLIAGATSIRIEFDPPANIPWQLVRVDPGGDTVIASGVDGTYEIDSGLVNGNTYEYYMVYNFGGGCGVKSTAHVTATTDCERPYPSITSLDDTLNVYQGESSAIITYDTDTATLVTLQVQDSNGVITNPVIPLGSGSYTFILDTNDPTKPTSFTFTMTVQNACDTVVVTTGISINWEQTPDLTLAVVPSEACPGKAYLNWTIDHALPGKVKITGPMFTGEQVVNANGELSGSLLVSTEEGTEEIINGTSYFKLDWTINGYSSSNVLLATTSTELCLKPKVKSFKVNGSSSASVPTCGGTVTIDWEVINTNSATIIDTFGNAYLVAASGTMDVPVYNNGTFTIYPIETGCGAYCGVMSVSVSVNGGLTCADVPLFIKVIDPSTEEVPVFSLATCGSTQPADAGVEAWDGIMANVPNADSRYYNCLWEGQGSINGVKITMIQCGLFKLMDGAEWRVAIVLKHASGSGDFALWNGYKEQGCGPCGRYYRAAYNTCSATPEFVDVIYA